MSSDAGKLSRRELLTILLGSQAALMTGCSGPRRKFTGELLTPSLDLGHRIRDGFAADPGSPATEEREIVIVGAGVAGLTAAWRLKRAGFEDFAVLEIEAVPGGTSRSGERGNFRFPWGAHYVPTPMQHQRGLIQLLEEMDVIVGRDEAGEPIVAEHHLCRDPEERVWVEGEWTEGLYPLPGASDEDLEQLDRFRALMDEWVDRRDDQGRRMFAIPIANGSDSEQVRSLDQISMAQWLDENGFDSARLRWLVDYSCRDDYGLTVEQTSAWAGIFYFASRTRGASQSYQEVITWPEGNGHVVNHLAKSVQEKLRLSSGVYRLSKDRERGRTIVKSVSKEGSPAPTIAAKKLLFAAPQFMAPYLIEGYAQNLAASAKQFRYGSWIAANIHLSDRPSEQGMTMCWDNVIYGSKSLGYVCATHQTGSDYGPTVLTWYLPIVSEDERLSRRELLAATWDDWVEVVLADLKMAHPDIESLIERIDVMLWGHAMIQPRPGFIWSDARMQASQPFGAIHFANTDLSGVALMEEAFYHGVRGAEEMMTALGHDFDTIL